MKSLFRIAACSCGISLATCAPQPQPVDVARSIDAISKLTDVASIQTTSLPFAEPTPDVESLLRAKPTTPDDLPADWNFTLAGDGLRIIGLKRHGVFLVTADGMMMVLVPEFEAIKHELFWEGTASLAEADHPELEKKSVEAAFHISQYILINVYLADLAMQRLPERLAAELRMPATVGGRESWTRIAGELLHQKVHLTGRTSCGLDLSRDLELAPTSRQKLVEVLSASSR